MISKLYLILSTPIKDFLYWQAGRVKIGPAQKTVHIVRMDAIGDSVLFSIMLPHFRKLYPGYKIILIVDGVVKQLTPWLNEQRILGPSSDNYFDDIMVIDGKNYNRNFSYYYSTLKKIRQSNPEVVIHSTFSRNKKSDQIVLISKEAQKIGYEGDLSNISPELKKKNDARYDRLIGNPASILETDHNMHFLNELAGRKVLQSGVPQWHLPENLRGEIKERLKALGIDLLKPLVAICPGSSRSVKNWPAPHFVSLMARLKNTLPAVQFIIIGGPKEMDVAAFIETNAGIKNVYNLCGKTTLPDLVKIVSRAHLYIGNNTGSLHLSSAVGTSAISIMSGEKGGKGEYDSRFFPYPAWKEGSCNIAVWNADPEFAGIENVKVDDVFNEAMGVLRKIVF